MAAGRIVGRAPVYERMGRVRFCDAPSAGDSRYVKIRPEGRRSLAGMPFRDDSPVDHAGIVSPAIHSLHVLRSAAQRRLRAAVEHTGR